MYGALQWVLTGLTMSIADVGRKTSSIKNEILAATVRLVAAEGTRAATMRAVAREVGVTEAAIYRHYSSKEDLWLRAYLGVVEEMAEEQACLLVATSAFPQRLRECIRLNFGYYDRNPGGFTYALLVPHVVTTRHAAARQRDVVARELVRAGIESAALRRIPVDLAFTHFAGLMLSVPRRINERTLPGPAVQYVDAVFDAVWRVLAP